MKTDAQIMAEIQAEHNAVIRKAIAQVMREIDELRQTWAEDDRQRKLRGDAA